MSETKTATCKACAARKEDDDRRVMSEKAERVALAAVSLVPGRAAALVEFTAEEVDALRTVMLAPSIGEDENSDGAHFTLLESRGVSFDMWHRVFVKIGRADQELDKARRAVL